MNHLALFCFFVLVVAILVVLVVLFVREVQRDRKHTDSERQRELRDWDEE